MHTATLLRMVRRLLPQDPAWLATWDTDHIVVTGPRDINGPVLSLYNEEDLRRHHPELLEAIVAWECQRLAVTPAILDFMLSMSDEIEADNTFPAPEIAETPRTWYYYASHRSLRRGVDRMGQPAVFLPCPEKPMDLPMQSSTTTYVVTQQPIDEEIVDTYTLKLVARPWTPEAEQRMRAQYALPDAVSR